jgi:hypothetical protein
MNNTIIIIKADTLTEFEELWAKALIINDLTNLGLKPEVSRKIIRQDFSPEKCKK